VVCASVLDASTKPVSTANGAALTATIAVLLICLLVESTPETASATLEVLVTVFTAAALLVRAAAETASWSTVPVAAADVAASETDVCTVLLAFADAASAVAATAAGVGTAACVATAAGVATTADADAAGATLVARATAAAAAAAAAAVVATGATTVVDAAAVAVAAAADADGIDALGFEGSALTNVSTTAAKLYV
jgi:trimeric autotransporter adhesin